MHHNVLFVFKSCRKSLESKAGYCRLAGSEFQTVGPAAEKAQLPKVQ